MDSSGTQAVVDWLMDGARSTPLAQEVLSEICRRLTACGLPLWRAVVFVRTLHPQIVGRRFVWRPDTGTVVTDGAFDLLERDVFRNSPMTHVAATGEAFRRRLADPDCPLDYPILHDLRAEGVTDYVVSPLCFTNGEIHFASWATRQPGGFADAAIWLSDMRGFTKLADRLPPQALVDLLNRYFDCQVPPILEHGGEVLKFMGDGLLAIFPIAEATASVCAQALAAALAARTNVAGLQGANDATDVRFGLALHVGDVLYGNIGSGNRLDFTTIGPAVNLAARLEKLA